MPQDWKDFDLHSGGLQSANVRLAQLLKRRPIASALVALFPPGLHRACLEDRRGAWFCRIVAAAAVICVLSGQPRFAAILLDALAASHCTISYAPKTGSLASASACTCRFARARPSARPPATRSGLLMRRSSHNPAVARRARRRSPSRSACRGNSPSSGKIGGNKATAGREVWYKAPV